MSTNLPRPVLMWLTRAGMQVRNPRRDFADGFLVAELLSHYVSLSLHSYERFNSVQRKRRNWQLLSQVFERHAIEVEQSLMEAVMNERSDAAVQLLTLLYETLEGPLAGRGTSWEVAEEIERPSTSSLSCPPSELVSQGPLPDQIPLIHHVSWQLPPLTARPGEQQQHMAPSSSEHSHNSPPGLPPRKGFGSKRPSAPVLSSHKLARHQAQLAQEEASLQASSSQQAAERELLAAEYCAQLQRALQGLQFEGQGQGMVPNSAPSVLEHSHRPGKYDGSTPTLEFDKRPRPTQFAPYTVADYRARDLGASAGWQELGCLGVIGEDHQLHARREAAQRVRGLARTYRTLLRPTEDAPSPSSADATAKRRAKDQSPWGRGVQYAKERANLIVRAVQSQTRRESLPGLISHKERLGQHLRPQHPKIGRPHYPNLLSKQQGRSPYSPVSGEVLLLEHAHALHQKRVAVIEAEFGYRNW